MSRGTLHVVATPIGNLEDITRRALRILAEVSLVAAEDTRRTGNLLRHYEIRTPLLSLHAHNERERVSQVLAMLAEGRSVALVTDAGTPGVSDPGAVIVRAAREAGFRVEPVPGASAVVAAISAAGLSSEGFLFLGFPPIRSKDRKIWWERFQSAPTVARILFEAPHRLPRTLVELSEYLGECQIFVARELTKLHEELVWGTPSELAERFAAARGEFTLVVPAHEGRNEPAVPASSSDILALFGQITENKHLSTRLAAKMVAERLGMPTKDVYEVLKNRPKDQA